MSSKNKNAAPKAEKEKEIKEVLPVEEKTDIPEKCEKCDEECKGAKECKKYEPVKEEKEDGLQEEKEKVETDTALDVIKENLEKRQAQAIEAKKDAYSIMFDFEIVRN